MRGLRESGPLLAKREAKAKICSCSSQTLINDNREQTILGTFCRSVNH